MEPDKAENIEEQHAYESPKENSNLETEIRRTIGTSQQKPH